MGARPRVLRAEPRVHDCIEPTSYLFPEVLERVGRGWRSLAAFLLSSPTALWAGGVQRVWDQGEKQQALGLHAIGLPPSPTSSLPARLGQAARWPSGCTVLNVPVSSGRGAGKQLIEGGVRLEWVLFRCDVCSFSTWPLRARLAWEADSSLKGLCSWGSPLRQEANQGARGGRRQPGSSLPCGPQWGVRSSGRKDRK